MATIRRGGRRDHHLVHDVAQLAAFNSAIPTFGAGVRNRRQHENLLKPPPASTRNNASPDRLLDHWSNASMSALRSLPFLILLTGCIAKPECDSNETRNAVLQSISNDHDNALVDYAAKHSNAQEKMN